MSLAAHYADAIRRGKGQFLATEIRKNPREASLTSFALRVQQGRSFDNVMTGVPPNRVATYRGYLESAISLIPEEVHEDPSQSELDEENPSNVTAADPGVAGRRRRTRKRKSRKHRKTRKHRR